MDFFSFLPRPNIGMLNAGTSNASTSAGFLESTARRFRKRCSPSVESLFGLILLPVTLVFAVDMAPAQSVPVGGPEAYVNEVRDPVSLRSGQPEMPASRPSRSEGALRKDPVATPADSTAPARKSPGWALAYSLGGTVLLTPLFGTGLIAGPAVGHFYAGNTRQAWTGIAVRSGAALTFGTGVLLVAKSTPKPVIGAEDPPLGDWAGNVGVGLMGVGIGVGLGSLIYDIATAPGSAVEHNRRRGVQARVMPAVGPRGKQVGLSVRLQF